MSIAQSLLPELDELDELDQLDQEMAGIRRALSSGR